MVFLIYGPGDNDDSGSPPHFFLFDYPAIIFVGVLDLDFLRSSTKALLSPNFLFIKFWNDYDSCFYSAFSLFSDYFLMKFIKIGCIGSSSDCFYLTSCSLIVSSSFCDWVFSGFYCLFTSLIELLILACWTVFSVSVFLCCWDLMVVNSTTSPSAKSSIFPN